VSATRIAVAAIGVLVAYAGIEHGIGEIRQGFVAPDSLVIESWRDTPGVEMLSGEPAMTVVPNLALAGVLTILAAVALGVWAVWFAQQRPGGAVLVGLSLLLLLVGGGFGPPLIGSIAGITATRIGHERPGEPSLATRTLAALWPWALIACLLGYLALVPGVVLLSQFGRFENAYVVSALIVFAFATLTLSLVSARATDHVRAAAQSVRGVNREVRPRVSTS